MAENRGCTAISCASDIGYVVPRRTGLPLRTVLRHIGLQRSHSSVGGIDSPKEAVMYNEEWNWQVDVLADQDVFLDGLGDVWGCPLQFGNATDAIFSEAGMMQKQLRA